MGAWPRASKDRDGPLGNGEEVSVRAKQNLAGRARKGTPVIPKSIRSADVRERGREINLLEGIKKIA